MQNQYYILKGIDSGIQLKPAPYDDSQGDGKVWHNGERVMSFPDPLTANNYMQVYGVNVRSHGYIHMKHLDPPPQQYAPPPGPPPPPRYTTVMSNLQKHPIAYQDSVTQKWYAVGPDGKSWDQSYYASSPHRKERGYQKFFA